MISEIEAWACAQQIISEQGAEALNTVAYRMEECLLAGDREGVATWRAIGDRAERLMDFSGVGKSHH